MKNQTTLIYVIAFAVLVISGIIAYKAFMPEKEESNASDNQNPPPQPQPQSAVFAKRGDRGAKVRELQSFLNSTGRLNKNIAVDGIFGPNTESATRSVFGTKSVSSSQWADRARYK